MIPAIPPEQIGDPPTVEELQAGVRICIVEGGIVQLTQSTKSLPDHFSWVKLTEFTSNVPAYENDTEEEIAAWRASMALVGACPDAKSVERGPDLTRGTANSYVECGHAVEVELVRTIETDGTVDGAKVTLPGILPTVTFIVNIEDKKRKESALEGCYTPHIGVLRKIVGEPTRPSTPPKNVAGGERRRSIRRRRRAARRKQTRRRRQSRTFK